MEVIEVNFYIDDKPNVESTGKVVVPFLPRIGDTVLIDFKNEKLTHFKIKDVLIAYEKDFSIKFIEIFVIGLF